MNNLKSNLFVFIFIILVSACDSWFNYDSEDWKLEPEYLSCQSINFGEELNSQTFYIFNNGEHSKISFDLITDNKWIVPSITSGTINKDEDKSIIVDINRSFLIEGINKGELMVYIDDDLWKIPTMAIGTNKIEISPQYINYGSNDDTAILKIRSLSGSRDIEIISPVEWLSVSDKYFHIEEYNIDLSTTEKSIIITCKRGLLEEGEYASSIEVFSGLGVKLLSIPISVTIPSQNEVTVAIDNYVFSLFKHLYREGNDIVLELKIKNHKYLKKFELLSTDSYAFTDGKKYNVSANSVTIQPNKEGVMKIYIKEVDESIKAFSNITLTFRDLSKTVVFQDVNL